MFLLSSAQQGSDPVFTFTLVLGTKPLTYGNTFTKYIKWLLKQLGQGTDYSSRSFRRGGANVLLQIVIPGEIILVPVYW